jgi:hypothetical protein
VPYLADSVWVGAVAGQARLNLGTTWVRPPVALVAAPVARNRTGCPDNVRVSEWIQR